MNSRHSKRVFGLLFAQVDLPGFIVNDRRLAPCRFADFALVDQRAFFAVRTLECRRPANFTLPVSAGRARRVHVANGVRDDSANAPVHVGEKQDLEIFGELNAGPGGVEL